MQSTLTKRSSALVVLVLFLVALGLTSPGTSAPPRPARRAARPRPARRPARARQRRTVRTTRRSRVGTVRPVVYGTGSSGRVVVVQGGSGSTAPAETQTPTESTSQPTQEPTTQPAEMVEKTETTEKTESAEKSEKTTPSDTNPDFAGSPAYEVLRVEDEGVTLVLRVDGEETKVRMIGVAPMEMRAKPRRRPPSGKSDQSRPPRPAGTDRPRQPRGDSDRPERAGKDKEPKKLTNLFMANMLRGEKVYVVYDEAVEEQDEDGKFIAYIYRAPDGLLVNMEAVRLGFAAADTSYDFADKETFRHYQEKARKMDKGIWGMMKRQRQGRPHRTTTSRRASSRPSLRVQREPRREVRFSRPEDRGEDLSGLTTTALVRRLWQSKDRVEQRKAAKVLGDRNLAGKLSLSQDERLTLDKYIDKQVSFTAAATGGERVEASDQIRRLWRLTADKLIDNLGSDNRTIVEAAVKNLALMRDTDIVGKIIAQIKASNDASFKKGAILALGMMREKRDCLVPDRKTLGDDESETMAAKIIVPFLTELQAKEKDPETLQMIKMAFQFLKNPPDARLRPSAGR